MPIKIIPVKGGFKVTDGNKYFSKNPLTKTQAQKQKIAILIHEHTKIFI